MENTATTRRLAQACRVAGIREEHQLLALAARLSPAESLLLAELHQAGEPGIDGAELRRRLAGRIANVSATAAVVNAKLQRNGLPAWRVACLLERGARRGMGSRWCLAYHPEADTPATSADA